MMILILIFFVKANKTNKTNILKKIKFEKMTKKDF